MSTRMVRKILKEQDELLLHRQEQEQLDEDQTGGSPTSSPSRNPFDLLNEEDDDAQMPEDESDSEATLTENAPKEEVSSVPRPVNGDHKSKKKKKKKKKSKESSVSDDADAEDSVEIALKSLSLNDGSSGHQPGTLTRKHLKGDVHGRLVKQGVHSILQIDPKYLRPENELRRIFGSKVVNSFEKTNQPGSSRQLRGGRRGGHILRKTLLVSPAENWPAWDKSLLMELLETKDGFHYFRYAHSSSYIYAQRAFEAAKAMNDLNGIAHILVDHPYHVDSLMAMAEFYKFAGEQQMSADVLARCLYALECAWHPMFTPLQGNCQLKFVHDKNKAFYSAVFMHMKNLDRRGCHRSGLEICKLLLSLDSDDPMGALFCIDYFALRAAQYSWLEQFAEDQSHDYSLWLFPNFSFSLAICRFYLEQEEKSNSGDRLSHKASSTELMSQALMLHPSVLKNLVVKVPLKDHSWNNILKHALFKSDEAGSPTLDHLINIYVERHNIIWRLPDLQKLLKESALLVIETLEQSTCEAENWACVREEAFSPDKNEYSHLLVSDFSDRVPTIPPENLQNLMGGPGPGMRVAADHHPEGGNPAPRDVANRHPLAVLLESILPWIDYGGMEHGENNELDRVDEDH